MRFVFCYGIMFVYSIRKYNKRARRCGVLDDLQLNKNFSVVRGARRYARGQCMRRYERQHTKGKRGARKRKRGKVLKMAVVMVTL